MENEIQRNFLKREGRGEKINFIFAVKHFLSLQHRKDCVDDGKHIYSRLGYTEIWRNASMFEFANRSSELKSQLYICLEVGSGMKNQGWTRSKGGQNS